MQEPNSGNIQQWLNYLYGKFQPLEQMRWNSSNIDSLFYAGNQSFVNRQLTFPNAASQQWYFNIIHTPIDLLTGRQRQRRKSITYSAEAGGDPKTTDQYTRLIMNTCNREGIHEAFSKSCELSAVAGLNLMQPYLDYTGDDPAQGSLKVKIWEYNSFIIDPYSRCPALSDANFIWCQEYISKQEADLRFPDKTKNIAPMSGSPQRYGRFYFLPENYNMAQNDLMVLSYVWYKWNKKKKRLYSQSRKMFYDYAQGADLEEILYNIPDLEEVTVTIPCWKCAVVLNDQLMFNGDNPLGLDTQCPFIPNFWNYEPHLSDGNLRNRSLIFPMRSSQYLMNHKILTNNDAAAAVINSGYKRKQGAVANEDNLKKKGAGFDVIINDGYEMTDFEKIVPTAIPESDLALAQQMNDLMFQCSGINLENWTGQDDKQISTLTMLIKQDANLTVFQKFFDQWDHALKLLGDRLLLIALNNWNAEKIKLIIGEEPTEWFYSRVFAKYKVEVGEGLLTPTQKNYQASQLFEINERFGREVFPPSFIIKDMNLQGKAEALEFLQQQEQALQAQQEQKDNIAHAFEDAKLKELYSKAVANIARAREDHSRSESNLGLYEERISMIERNKALTLKEKQAAMTSLLENIQKYGEIENEYAENKLKIDEYGIMAQEEFEKQDVERRTEANKFYEQIMGSFQGRQQNAGAQNEQAML